MNNDTTPCESMVQVPAHDACDTTIVVAPGPMLEPTPIVLQRQASDVAFMSPEVLREKLRATPKKVADVLREQGYREPILPRTCAVDGCVNFTHELICQDCEIELEALAQQEEDDKRIARAFWPVARVVLAIIARVVLAIIALVLAIIALGLLIVWVCGWLS